MIRKIITIDQDKCTGCGACAAACHEGAIEIIYGKAALTREDYCDGLGDCLPECPTNAITFEEREAPAYDAAAVLAAKQQKQARTDTAAPAGCPGTQMRQLATSNTHDTSSQSLPSNTPAVNSQLAQWPCQMKLAPVHAPYFKDANLLVAADCTAYAYANIHGDFMKGRVTLIGCPKLDSVDYSEKLTEILKNNDIKSLLVLRMEVPCCGGLEMAAKKALQNSGKTIPWQVVTISIHGKILDDVRTVRNS